MAKRFFEDFVQGTVVEHGPRLITREEIISFAAEFDPQPVHLDEDAARLSLLGGLSASGWHICGIAMRMIADHILSGTHGMGSPGVDEVRWLRPLRPGDRVTLRATVLNMRTSQSRPAMGLVFFRYDLINQGGETIMTMTSTMMVTRRPEGQAA